MSEEIYSACKSNQARVLLSVLGFNLPELFFDLFTPKPIILTLGKAANEP